MAEQIETRKKITAGHRVLMASRAKQRATTATRRGQFLGKNDNLKNIDVVLDASTKKPLDHEQGVKAVAEHFKRSWACSNVQMLAECNGSLDSTPIDMMISCDEVRQAARVLC